jgi:hypothetical protein
MVVVCIWSLVSRAKPGTSERLAITPIAAATMAEAMNTAPAEPSRIERSVQVKKGRECWGQRRQRPLAAQVKVAAELLLATAYNEGSSFVPAGLLAIFMKTVSNFSRIRMMNGGCAYRKIAFS